MKTKLAWFTVAALILFSQTAMTSESLAQQTQYRPYELLAKQAQLRGNMRTLQIALETYAMDEGRPSYPRKIDLSVKSYYDGGVKRKKEGKPVANAFTGKPEWPIMGSFTSVEAARTAPPSALAPGVIEYSVIIDANGEPSSYVIRGGDATGLTYVQNGKTFILSNVDETPPPPAAN